AGARERLLGSGKMRTRDILVSDDRDLGAAAQRTDARAERCHEPATDHDVIAARIKRDIDAYRLAGAQRSGHALSSAAAGAVRNSASATISSATMVSCATSRDCTVRSACA